MVVNCNLHKENPRQCALFVPSSQINYSDALGGIWLVFLRERDQWHYLSAKMRLQPQGIGKLGEGAKAVIAGP